jgi:two-component system KDP operon response regulator KdpE
MTTAISHILVVEDEQHIRRFVRTALESEAYQVTEAGTCTQGLLDIRSLRLDMLILDLGLPDGDGVQLIQNLRTWSKLPVLVLSARITDQDKIKALDAGADDYLSKPFSTGELLARVRALLRRSQFNPDAENPLIRFSDVEVDLVQRKVSRKGETLHLTPIEFHLLSLLLLNAGRVMTHRHLLREVWGSTYVESNHYLRVYVGHLRQKLEDDPSQPRHLLTETGIGYRFQL